MPDQPGATVFQPVGRVVFKQDRQFGFDSLTDQLPRAVAHQIGQRVGGKSRWIGQMGDGRA
jgi:hypothetical protein